LRKNLGKDDDDRAIHIDGKGIKILFNHGIRRFMSGQISREPWTDYTKTKLVNFGLFNGLIVSFKWGFNQIEINSYKKS